MIPEEIKQKIEDKATELCNNCNGNRPYEGCNCEAIKKGAEYGYSLASEQPTAAEARIKELEEGISKIMNSGESNVVIYEKLDQLLNK